jgi:hypothetical protein
MAGGSDRLIRRVGTVDPRVCSIGVAAWALALLGVPRWAAWLLVAVGVFMVLGAVLIWIGEGTRADSAPSSEPTSPPESPTPIEPTAATPSPRDLHVSFRYDEEGYLNIRVENEGPQLDEARINLLAPYRYNGRHIIYRVDRTTGVPVSEKTGWDETPHELIAGCPKSLRWTEYGLTLFGFGTTEWKFFLPYVEGDPIYFRAGCDALGGWTDDLIATTPATLTASKATSTFVAERRKGHIVITFAMYGAAGAESDVKDRLVELIDDDGVLDFIVDNATLVGAADPAPGVDKNLRMRWQEDGVARASSFDEYVHVVIPDP